MCYHYQILIQVAPVGTVYHICESVLLTFRMLEDSIGRPLFVMFRNLIQLPEDDPRRHPILSVLAEMLSHQPRVGYLLLYFLKAW
jgi:hypothetical protein